MSSRHYPKFVKHDYVLSSLLYPYIDGDSLTIQGGFNGGQILPMPIEIMQIGADFVGGETRSILKVHHQPIEDILKIGGDFVGGETRSILKVHHQPPEDMLNLGADFVGGELRRILISYHAPVEDVLNLGADFVGGELK